MHIPFHLVHSRRRSDTAPSVPWAIAGYLAGTMALIARTEMSRREMQTLAGTSAISCTGRRFTPITHVAPEKF